MEKIKYLFIIINQNITETKDMDIYLGGNSTHHERFIYPLIIIANTL